MIRPGESAVERVRGTVGPHVVEAYPVDDLTFQATTRGGRVMDHVLANKAVFKSTADALGDLALISGAVVGAHDFRKHTEASLGLLAFGLLSKLTAAGTRAEADTRVWDNLPNYLTLVVLTLVPGPHVAAIEFLDPSGGIRSSRRLEFEVSQGGRGTVLFVSD